MKTIRLMLVLSLTIFVSSCEAIRVNNDRDAVLRDGILRDGIKVDTNTTLEKGTVTVEPGAVQGAITVHPDAVSMKAPLVDFKEGAFPQPLVKVDPEAVHVEKDAVHFLIEKGAVNLLPGAIQVNVNFNIGGKPPPIQKPKLDGLKPLGSLENIPPELKQAIISNEAIYQSVIKAVFDAIDLYNKKYAEEENKDEK